MGGSVLYFTSVLLIISGNIRYVAPHERINGPECGISRSFGRIIGGQPTGKKQIPWIVSITTKFPSGGNQLCGGSIISHSFVLTAAHCIFVRKTKETAQQIMVNYNSTRLSTGKVVLQQASAFPLQYDLQGIHGKGHDIAIIKLRNRLHFDDYVRPVCLPIKKMNIFTKTFVIAGWGAWERGGRSDILRSAVTRAIQYEDCNLDFEKNGLNKSIAICGFPLRKNGCFGDSGGPVTAKVKNGRHVLLGIIMGGSSCADYESFTVYTRVSGFLDWIKIQMKKMDVPGPNPC